MTSYERRRFTPNALSFRKTKSSSCSEFVRSSPSAPVGRAVAARGRVPGRIALREQLRRLKFRKRFGTLFFFARRRRSVGPDARCNSRTTEKPTAKRGNTVKRNGQRCLRDACGGGAVITRNVLGALFGADRSVD